MMIKSRRERWAGHVSDMGEMRNVYKILVGSLKEEVNSENLVVDGKIILQD
jgi:cytidylate kinase